MPYRPFQSTYYDARMRAAPALLRARAPYLWKNTITGMAIVGLILSIYGYTIKAISQDEFDDVVVPDTPLQKTATSTTDGVKEAMARRQLADRTNIERS